MRKWLILALLSLSGPALAQQSLWTWVDDAGVVHFSDRPVPGARQIEVGAPQTYTPPARTSTPAQQPQQQESSLRYRDVAIAAPAQDETLWNIGGTMTVTVATDPPLAAGHLVDLYFDGRRLDAATAGTSFTVTNVFRGTHTVQAVIIDAATEIELQRSGTVTFHVQQTSTQNPQSPPRGPALQTGN